MMKILLYLVFSFSAVVSYSQELYIGKTAKFITQFPFKQLSGGVIILQARFDSIQQPFNFILDTGSGGISLDSSTAAEYKISHIPSGRSINGIAGIREVDYAKNNSLVLPGLKVDSLDFYINNYDILSSVYGIKIDGIIGYSFFCRYIVSVNFDSLRIAIYHPGKFLYPSGGTLLRPLFTALPIEPLIIKDLRTVDDNFYIDTGAGLCFLMSKQFNDDSSVLKRKRKPVLIQVQGSGGKKEMELTVIKELQIGPYKFRRVPTNILDDEFNATSYPFLGGLIGDDILRRFNLIINYPKREIHLAPNSHYYEDFDYSYTGMNMYYFKGKIYTDDVIKNSPAYKAGLKRGDIIVGVNKNLTNNVEAYKNLMQTVGEKIELLILRNNSPMIISFRVGKIF